MQHDASEIWADGGVRGIDNWLWKARNVHAWEGFILDTYPRVLRLPVPPLTNTSGRMAVIVEPRRHVHLHYVVRNVMHFLGRGWGLCIFHGTGNVDQVKHIASGFSGDPPLLVNVGTSDLPIPEYNRLLTSIDRFWKIIPAETVLVFQSDSLLRHPFDLSRYPKGCHYVGAPWPRGSEPMGLPFGNGGISLRSRAAMIRVLEDHPRDPSDPDALPEDVHFSFYVRTYDDAIVPSIEQAAMFSTECAFVCDSDAVHPNLYALSSEDLRSILSGIRYPPEGGAPSRPLGTLGAASSAGRSEAPATGQVFRIATPRATSIPLVATIDGGSPPFRQWPAVPFAAEIQDGSPLFRQWSTWTELMQSLGQMHGHEGAKLPPLPYPSLGGAGSMSNGGRGAFRFSAGPMGDAGEGGEK